MLSERKGGPLSRTYPEERWTHVYTDGSAEEATRNGGGGIYVRLPDGGTIQKSIPTGTVSTNYKAEAEALQTAATTLEENRDNTHNRVVIFSDALSVLQALLSPRNKDLNTLAASLARLQQSTEHTVIQWVPSHCNIHGNEEADRLAKDGSRLPQEEQELNFEEAKTIVREIQRRRWRQEHPDHNNSDGYYHLSREDQVIIVRLRTGHCRLKHHMFTKFNIGI
nr:hypothetical protein BaRGS_000466 [Batillaria attramentaria]